MEVLDQEPALDQEKVCVLGRYLDGHRERERETSACRVMIL